MTINSFKKKILAWDELDKNFYVLKNNINTKIIPNNNALIRFIEKVFKIIKKDVKIINKKNKSFNPFIYTDVKTLLVLTTYLPLSNNNARDSCNEKSGVIARTIIMSF